MDKELICLDTSVLIDYYRKKENQIIGIKDILIGSTALSKGLNLATLNRKDFERITRY